jgi:hypothetical protein
MRIDTTFVHDAVRNTPVHMGDETIVKTEEVLNHRTGTLDTKTVETVKPIVGILQTVEKNVETQHTTDVNLKTGQVVNQNAPLVRVGTDK